MSIVIKNFYLATPMKQYEYLKLKLCNIPEEIIKDYNLHSIASPNKSVYVKVRKGMYGLFQARIAANKLLVRSVLTRRGTFKVCWYLVCGRTRQDQSCLYW